MSLFLLLLLALVVAFNDVIIFSEIQYSPPIGGSYEYVEVGSRRFCVTCVFLIAPDSCSIVALLRTTCRIIASMR